MGLKGHLSETMNQFKSATSQQVGVGASKWCRHMHLLFLYFLTCQAYFWQGF